MHVGQTSDTFLRPQMRRSTTCRFPYGMHTPLQHETNLWSIPFAFCLTEAQQHLSPACKETPGRACRRQLAYLSRSISAFTWAEVVGCILRWAAPLLCVTGTLGHTFLEREGVRFKTRGGLESEVAAIYNHAGEGWGSMRHESGDLEGEWKCELENSGLPQTCTQLEREVLLQLVHWWQVPAALVTFGSSESALGLNQPHWL